jgi:hypothetical protein
VPVKSQGSGAPRGRGAPLDPRVPERGRDRGPQAIRNRGGKRDGTLTLSLPHPVTCSLRNRVEGVVSKRKASPYRSGPSRGNRHQLAATAPRHTREAVACRRWGVRIRRRCTISVSDCGRVGTAAFQRNGLCKSAPRRAMFHVNFTDAGRVETFHAAASFPVLSQYYLAATARARDIDPSAHSLLLAGFELQRACGPGAASSQAARRPGAPPQRGAHRRRGRTP